MKPDDRNEAAPPGLPGPDKLTPMFRQWREAKAQHPDALLLFRMGDFYELFFDDARTAAPLLEIALTARGKGTAVEAPMCGVPHHAVDQYVARLVERGLRVAICEQVEDPRTAKGMVRREVVRVVSPGTVTDPERLDPASSNVLAAVGPAPDRGFGVALVDLSTGSLVLARAADGAELADLLSRHEVREVLLADAQRGAVEPVLPELRGRRPLVTALAAERFHPALARPRVLEALGVSTLSGFGCPDDHPALPAAAAALTHLAATQRVRPAHLDRLQVDDARRQLVLDAATRRNLELVANLRDGTRTATLLETVDRTRTPLGARTVRAWLLEPLAELLPLARRHALVEELLQRSLVRRGIVEALARVRDLERLLGRAALGSASPRDLLALRHSLEALPEVRERLAELTGEPAAAVAARIDPLEDLTARLAAALADDPGVQPGDGRVIRPGHDGALDEARELARGGKQLVAEIETREREATGIASLKVRYNRVFGYFIEVSKSQLARVPPQYERRQTIATGERYTTNELRELETKILSAEERLAARETELFEALVREVAARASRLRETAAAVGELDALTGFAEAAAEHGWTRPALDLEDRIELEDSRHPVVERLLPSGRFVPNDCRLDAAQRILVVTGPNMGGKSTYLRQVALAIVMAQAGSFVPARRAAIGLVDRVFCRVGASDNLAGGESTFMVEMTETANILHNATPRSLVILDEIGRGTATWDGMAIAWAVVESLHDDRRLAPKALFATHYHELTELVSVLPRLANVHIAVREHGHDVLFLHRVEPGPSDRSYGIHVARLAGLPDRVVARAGEILEHLTAEHPRPGVLAPRADAAPATGRQLGLFGETPRDPREEQALAALRALDLDALSPREAHALLAALLERLR
ncbi:MAG: DNA mismatch repair protein MutS [Acidobacteria bacterium]|nr:DNA mismatch repair protein MutS [Acidobacteriota bacterium]